MSDPVLDPNAAPTPTPTPDPVPTPTPDPVPAPEAMFYDNFADDLKASPSITKFKTAEAMAEGYRNLESMNGRDKVALPNTPEERLAVFRKMGAPESIDALSLKGYQAPEGMEINPETMASLKQMAFDSGLHPEQAQAMHDWYFNLVGNAYSQGENSKVINMQQAEAELQAEWGGQYPVKKALADRAFATFGNEEFTKFMEESGLGNNPAMLNVFAKIAEAMSEDKLVSGLALATGGSPTAIQQEIADIQANPAYLNNDDPKHSGLVNRMLELNEAKNGLLGIK